MFETIVWATDGSELADRALEQVKELSRLHHSKIVAVHANEVLRGRAGGATLFADEPVLRTRIERQVEELIHEGFEAELNVRSGPGEVSHLTADAARDAGADLIVVGTHGHGGFKAALVGSVTRSLLHTARCPVLAIPPAREAAEATRQPEIVGAA